jgi:hypothetical protein
MIMAMATVGKKTWATFTFDNAYTRGIKTQTQIVIWGNFKYQYT